MVKLNGLPWVSVPVDDDDKLWRMHHLFDELGFDFDYNSSTGELMLSPGNCYIQFYSPKFTEQGWG
jgi:hypothetical protein